MTQLPRKLLIAGMAALLAACGEDGGNGETDTQIDTGEEDVLEEDAAGEDAAEDVEGEELPEEPDPVWERFLEEREDYLVELGAPILYCVTQTDTTNPAFHGCMDWHSSVEGIGALLALTRATGDPAYEAAAELIITPDAIAAELAQLEAGGPEPSEVPYGYSWFMQLAIEREASGETDLVPLADIVSGELLVHVTNLTRTQIDGALMSDDYLNLSWEVLNLWKHATFRSDAAVTAQMVEYTRNEILPREHLCPVAWTIADLIDFFPPCLHRARLLLTVLPAEEAAAWAETGIPDGFTLRPIETPENLHAAGLNFSRSWDLLDLYEVTGDRSYRQMYVEHIEAHMAMPQYWRDDYLYAHWVPQFGVYAILRSYE